jgi:WD40 repeat protein
MNRITFSALLLAIPLTIVVCYSGPLPEANADPLEKDAPRTDRYGDPLPRGALTRLGTIRFRQPFPWILAFSPDGKTLAAGGNDCQIRFWDPEIGKELRPPLEGHTGFVNCLTFSSDGKLLASGSEDNDLRLWDVNSGKQLCRFQGHESVIECIALAPDGKTLASSCLGGTLRLWDTKTGKQVHSVPIDKGQRVGALAFTPDSKHLRSAMASIKAFNS